MRNFPNLMREKVTKVQEAKTVLIKMKQRVPPRQIITKTAKFKDRESKKAREKQEVTYTGAPISLAADFSREMLQARREAKKYFKQ